MNKKFKQLLSVTTLLSVVALEAGTQPVTPTFVARSQGFDSPRQVAGMVNKTGLYDMDEMYGTLSITPFYSRSFRSSDIAHCLFGNDLVEGTCDGRSINIEGLAIENRNNNTSWLADYFYLPSDFKSTLSFDPVIQNAGVDFQFWMGLDEWYHGLYFALYVPVVWTKWDLNFEESVTAPGSLNYFEGYFSPAQIERNLLLKDFATYVSGGKVANVVQPRTAAGGDPQTIVFQELKFAKICKDSSKSKGGVADLRAKFGWNFYNEEDWGIGLNLQAAAPTGNKRKAEFAFAPVVGNGNHWELGGGLNFHYTFWRSEDAEKSFGFYIDSNVTHLFKADEQRTFDLKNKPVSRYMLAQKMTSNVQFGLGNQDGTVLATSQFANEYAPIANLTTFDVDVSVGAQGNVNAWFNYTTSCLGWDFGYNFYGRSCEKIRINDKCPIKDLDGKTWGIKGAATKFGKAQQAVVDPSIAINDSIALSGTQSTALLTNPGNTLDNATPAFAGGNTAATRTPLNTLGDPAITSLQAVLLNQPSGCENSSTGDVDLSGTRNISHTVWTHLQWDWDREGWVPYLGLGGSVEFSSHHSDKKCPTTTPTTSTTCPKSDCLSCGLSQWQIWLKTGVSF